MSPASTPASTGNPHEPAKASTTSGIANPDECTHTPKIVSDGRAGLRVQDHGERERSEHAQQRQHSRGQLCGQLASLGPVRAPDARPGSAPEVARARVARARAARVPRSRSCGAQSASSGRGSSVGCCAASPVRAKNIDSSGLIRSSSRRTATPSWPSASTNESSSLLLHLDLELTGPRAARAHAGMELGDLERALVVAGGKRIGRRRRLCPQLRGAAAPHDLTAGNDGEAIASALDLADQMAAQQHRDPL